MLQREQAKSTDARLRDRVRRARTHHIRRGGHRDGRVGRAIQAAPEPFRLATHLRGLRQSAPADVARTRNCDLQHPSSSGVAATRPITSARRAPRAARDDERPPRGLGERIQARGSATRGADPPAMQHSASATAIPPSAMSCALRSPSGPDPDGPRRARASRHRRRPRAGSGPAIGSPRSLAELRAREPGRRPRPARSRRPPARTPAARPEPGSGRRADHPDHRRREDRPAAPRCRARRCRR